VFGQVNHNKDTPSRHDNTASYTDGPLAPTYQNHGGQVDNRHLGQGQHDGNHLPQDHRVPSTTAGVGALGRDQHERTNPTSTAPYNTAGVGAHGRGFEPGYQNAGGNWSHSQQAPGPIAPTGHGFDEGRYPTSAPMPINNGHGGALNSVPPNETSYTSHPMDHSSTGAGAGTSPRTQILVGKVEKAVGSLIRSDELKAEGFAREEDAKRKIHEKEAERLEAQARMYREHAAQHGEVAGQYVGHSQFFAGGVVQPGETRRV
jgi:hypothetical protein